MNQKMIERDYEGRPGKSTGSQKKIFSYDLEQKIL
jgi:hypothetical protein